eukprot:1160109-Pelagomonas_calceolata.AAC.7
MQGGERNNVHQRWSMGYDNIHACACVPSSGRAYAPRAASTHTHTAASTHWVRTPNMANLVHMQLYVGIASCILHSCNEGAA